MPPPLSIGLGIGLHRRSISGRDEQDPIPQPIEFDAAELIEYEEGEILEY